MALTRNRLTSGFIAGLLTMLALGGLSACNDDQGTESTGAGGGGSSESADVAGPNSAKPDASDDDLDEQVVCDLLSNDEIREATGFEVVSAEGSISGLPACEWELAVPEAAEIVGFPLLSVVLLPESDYRVRVDPLSDGVQDIDGLGYEVKFYYAAGNPDSGIPARMYFFALNGNQGIQILSGFAVWDNEEAAKSALLDMADKIFERT